MPKISVLMIVRNQDKYILDSVNSILNQTYKDFEFIIFDDYSLDHTTDILRKVKDNRIKLFINKKRLGLTKSLNIGLSKCKGEYVARMDGDDISEKNRLKEQISFLNTHSKVGVIGSCVKTIDEQGNITGLQKFPHLDKQIRDKLTYFNPFRHSTVIFRKNLIDAYGSYDISLDGAEDYDLWLRFAKYTKFHNLGEALLKYRVHPESVSSKQEKKVLKSAVKARLKSINTYGFSFSYWLSLFVSVTSYYLPSDLKKVIRQLISMTLDSVNGKGKKILFVCEYFYPFAHGGSERSIYYLAEDLINRGNQVFVCTYNFGTRSTEIWDRITIYRIPTLVRMKKDKPHPVSPFTFSNPINTLYTFLYLLALCIKIRPHTIHIQSSYMIIAGLVASKFLRIPSVLTLRDYQPLCPLGYCVRKENNYQRCNFFSFLTSDIFKHINLYLKNSSLAAKLYFIMGSTWGWIYSILVRKCISDYSMVVTISNKEKDIYIKNNIKVDRVVYNSIQKQKYKNNKIDQVAFVGRLTYGKGAHLILDSFKSLLKLYPKLKLLIIGQGPLSKNIVSKVNDLGLSKNVTIAGVMSYSDALDKISQSKLTIVPSVWEEPFGRVALESIFVGTPVITTNNGGLPEIVKDGKYGYVIPADSRSISMGIIKGLRNNRELRNLIKKDSKKLSNKFIIDPANMYINLYKTT